jgi:hypothetical protein
MITRLAVSALALSCAGTPAHAAEMMAETYSFAVNLGGPTPMPSGTFTFIPGTLMTWPTLLEISFKLGDTVFTTQNATIAADNEAGLFVLGGTLNFPYGVVVGTDDFLLTFRRDSRIPIEFRYAQVGSNQRFATSSVNNTISNPNIQLVRISSAVPEPGTWGMMLLGFGAVGYSIRSRRAGCKALQAT